MNDQQRFIYSAVIAFVLLNLSFYIAVSSLKDGTDTAAFSHFGALFSAVFYAGIFGLFYLFIRSKPEFDIDITTLLDKPDIEKLKPLAMPVGALCGGIVVFILLFDFMGIYFHTLAYILNIFNTGLFTLLLFIVYHFAIAYAVVLGTSFLEHHQSIQQAEQQEREAIAAKERAKQEALAAEAKRQQEMAEAAERQRREEAERRAREEERQRLVLTTNIKQLSQQVENVSAKNARMTQEIRTLEHIIAGLDIFDDDFLDNYPKVLQYIDEEYQLGRVG